MLSEVNDEIHIVKNTFVYLNSISKTLLDTLIVPQFGKQIMCIRCIIKS